MFRSFIRLALLTLCVSAGTALAAPGRSVTDFSNGTNGWEGMQPGLPTPGEGTWIDVSAGTPAPALRSLIPETWFVTWTNRTPALTGDYRPAGSLSISLDVYANSIIYLDFMEEVSRQLVVELRDYDNAEAAAFGLPYASVWYDLGTIAAGMGWQHLSVTIADTNATALPAGWGGYGAETRYGDPILPPGTTFADVLAGIDEVAFTTAVPGWFYGYTYFDVVLDNISITPVPEPGMPLLHLAGLATLGLTLRRRLRRRD